jgi:hypothetical protein
MSVTRRKHYRLAAQMPSKARVAACKWMTEGDLRVYSTEYIRTGFQGGLNSYRIFGNSGELNSFSGRTKKVNRLLVEFLRQARVSS